MVRDWNIIKKFHKTPITFKIFQRVSEVFRAFPGEDFQRFPNIFEKKVSEDRFENILTFSDFSEDFRRLPTISEDLKNVKNAERLF